MADEGVSNSSPGCMDGCTSYARTRKGIILAAEIGLCIIILICYGASVYPGYSTVPIFEMVFCILFFIIFMLQLDRSLSFIHWPWTDFIRAAIGALLFLITSLLVVIGRRDGAGIAGGVFGLLVGVLFAYDAYTIIPSLRKTHTPAATESHIGN